MLFDTLWQVRFATGHCPMPIENNLNDPIVLKEWLVPAWATSVPANRLHGVRVLGVDLVLWRSDEGLRAWRDLCVHRGAKLSLGQISHARDADCVVCPYHGWEYNSSGECARIPAHPEQAPPSRARVDQFSVREKYGLIWVCLDTPSGDVPAFPGCDLPGFRLVPTGAFQFHAQGTRMLE